MRWGLNEVQHPNSEMKLARRAAELAADYVEQAALIENKEKPAGVTGGT